MTTRSPGELEPARSDFLPLDLHRMCMQKLRGIASRPKCVDDSSDTFPSRPQECANTAFV